MSIRSSGARWSGVPIMAVAALFTGSVVVVAKLLGDVYAVVELMWFRYLIHMAMVAVTFGPRLGMRLVRSAEPRIQLVRSVMMLSTTTLFFLALRYLPAAETTAVVYLAPILTVLIAAPVLRETKDARTVMVAVVGFTGVVLVVQPFSGHFTIAFVLPLGAALTSSLYLLTTRLVARSDSAGTSLFYTGSAGLVVTSLLIPFFWTTPESTDDLLLLLLLGVLGGVGHLLIVSASQRSEASTLAPLGYLELGVVAVLGFILLGDFPNVLSLLGIGLITAAGAFVAMRNRVIGTPPVRT